MEKTTDLKKGLVNKGNAVKRLMKEYNYYSKDAEKAEALLKETKEQTTDEGALKRKENYVNECLGAKKQTFTSLVKFTTELEELLTRIDTYSPDEEAQKAKDEAKALPEYTNGQNYLSESKKLLEGENATSNTK